MEAKVPIYDFRKKNILLKGNQKLIALTCDVPEVLGGLALGDGGLLGHLHEAVPLDVVEHGGPREHVD